MHWLLNLVFYQLAWLAAVVLQSPWPVLALLALHLYLTPLKKADGKLMLLFMAAGVVVDGSLGLLGLFEFAVGPLFIPLWLVALWAALAMLPNHSLAWLKGRLWLNAVFGAIGGPLAYWAGVRLGAAQFGWPLWLSLLTLAAVWALLWPFLMRQALRSLA
ncbi:DUF2878 domain-containing protein [Gallaecimonas mangrovi]|uniref:DUF2878 domain-containing protein n=1 Tax=Gallaecimonas mangrovi TaxID=2291597 RepID=UPI000E20B01E|nr:DUF2878 domain-containing protein [Gallaecimonas mangrovi]